MSYGQDFALDSRYEREESVASERVLFMRRTYGHLAFAILAFMGLVCLFYSIPIVKETIWNLRVAGGAPTWMLILFVVFMVVALLAQYIAHSTRSQGVAYLMLAIYIVFEAVMILPLIIFAADIIGDPKLISSAGIFTMALFAGLSVSVFITKKDFSFLGPILSIGCFLVLGIVLAAILLPGGISLGVWYSLAIVVLMSGFILYETSNVLHHYPTNMHVAASLALFSSVAIMFYHVLRIMIILASDR